MDNMRDYLSNMNSSLPLYLGFAFRNNLIPAGFLSGGAGKHVELYLNNRQEDRSSVRLRLNKGDDQEICWGRPQWQETAVQHERGRSWWLERWYAGRYFVNLRQFIHRFTLCWRAVHAETKRFSHRYARSGRKVAVHALEVGPPSNWKLESETFSSI